MLVKSNVYNLISVCKVHRYVVFGLVVAGVVVMLRNCVISFALRYPQKKPTLHQYQLLLERHQCDVRSPSQMITGSLLVLIIFSGWTSFVFIKAIYSSCVTLKGLVTLTYLNRVVIY